MLKEKEFYSYIYKNKNYFQGLESKRIKTILSRIPPSNSILDVGCGDGRLLNKINTKFKIGIDFAVNPLKYVKCLTYAANVEYLPFLDNSFELVICLEVLEHLKKNKLKKTLNELFRVSSRFILISVPYDENLNLRMVKCKFCHHLFHASLHYHSFNEKSLSNIFQDVNMVLMEKFGFREAYPKIFGRLKFIKRFNGSYVIKENIICPYCGKKDPCKKPNLLGKIFYYLDKFFNKIFFFSKSKKPVWILAIFEKSPYCSRNFDDVENILICPICQKKIYIESECAKCENGHIFRIKDNIVDFRV